MYISIALLEKNSYPFHFLIYVYILESSCIYSCTVQLIFRSPSLCSSVRLLYVYFQFSGSVLLILEFNCCIVIIEPCHRALPILLYQIGFSLIKQIKVKTSIFWNFNFSLFSPPVGVMMINGYIKIEQVHRKLKWRNTPMVF